MARKAVLFSEMTPGASWEDEFNHWYDTEHIPPRMGAPGFTSAQRYRNVDGPAYLAIYDLEDKGALATPEYKEIKANSGETSRRIMAGVKEPFTHLALHYLATPDALQPSAQAEARNSPWRMRLAQEEWFKDHFTVFRSIGQRFVATL
jgi:hypothetical protein